MKLDPKAIQNLDNETMGWKSKTSNEKRFKHNQLPLGSSITSLPGTRPIPDPKYPNYCISCMCLEEIRDSLNSTMSPSDKRVAIDDALIVSSIDNVFVKAPRCVMMKRRVA